jgi:hypothetical protein
MSVPFDLWGQRGWASMEVVGESHHSQAIKALFGANLKADGVETTATVRLLPEPLNKHDRNAVGVWAETGQIGYLPRQEAVRYAPVLMDLVARGWTPQVSARIWAAQWPADYRDHDGFSASVRLELTEPHLLMPANRPPSEPHELLPIGAAIQVTGEEKHLDALAPWLRPEGECWVYTTLHEVTEKLARSSRTVIELRIDGTRIGQLTPRMSGEVLAAVQHLDQRGLTTAARAIVKGNRIKAEVVLYAARAHELPDSWLATAAPKNAAPQPRMPAPVPVVPAAAAVRKAEPVVIPPAPAEPRAATPNNPAGLRFNAPPNWRRRLPAGRHRPGGCPIPAGGPFHRDGSCGSKTQR